MRKLKHDKINDEHVRKKLPDIAERDVWEKTRGRVGIRWENVGKKTCIYKVGEQEEVMSVKMFGGYNTETKALIKEKGNG